LQFSSIEPPIEKRYFTTIMRLLQNIRLFFQRRALRKALDRQPPARRSIHYDKARLIGILFDASELEERNSVVRFAEKLRQSGKKVSMLGFFDHAVESTDFLFPIFTEANFDWMLRPKGEALKHFLQEPQDLLIHAGVHGNMFAEFIAASSKAKLRVGPYTGRTECYELMVDVSGNTDVNYYLKQVEFLLEKTNPRHEVA
jgi:hypothetical protein